jgi:type I restriction enzyme S subunit
MLEKKLVPKLRFAEFDGVWKVKQIANILTIGSGKDYKHLSSGNIPVYGTGGFMTAVNEFIFDGESVCIGRKGTIDKPMFLNEKFWTVDTLFYTHSFSGVTPKFVYSLFQNIIWYKYNEASGVPSLSKNTIGKIEVTIPQLPEQQKIASFLTEVDTKLSQLTKKKVLLENYKKGVMQQIFSQELRFKDGNGNDYPIWEKKKLADFKNLISGDGNWILSQDITADGDYKIVQLGNIGFGLYVEKKLKTISSDKFVELKGTLINPGDLLINRMVDGALNCCILNKDGNYITSVDVCWIRQNNYFNNYFLMSLILFNENQNKLLNLSSGSGRVRISKKNLFNEFSFKLPLIQEQEKITSFLSDIDTKIEVLSTSIENTQTFKKGLLQHLFV